MIRFSLRCASGHEFEAWFRNGEGYEAQQQAGEIACPECGDTHVEKALMAPSIGRSREAGPADLAGADARGAGRDAPAGRDSNCDYVGPQFAEEARRIHYGESRPARHLRRGDRRANRASWPRKASSSAASPGSRRPTPERRVISLHRHHHVVDRQIVGSAPSRRCARR